MRLRPAPTGVLLTIVGAAALALAATPDAAPAAPRPPVLAAAASDLDALHAYIRSSWKALTRTHRDLPDAAVDPKFPDHQGPWPVYLSPRESLPTIQKQLAALLPPTERARIQLRHLDRGQLTGRAVDPGLIFLPRPYVVPGGRFNEMYGWDSHFIVLGLLRQNELELAQDMVHNAVYEVMHFGKVLNANRTYYLQRSQPPFLTAMIRAVYDVSHDKAWLASTLPAVRRQYRYWTTGPHLAGDSGLSRYHAAGVGPAPEVEAGERDAAGHSHYQRVRAALRAQVQQAGGGGNTGAAELAGLDIARFYDQRRDRLTARFYEADRSMRESGFDPSDRFGRFGLGVLDYAPVCLNSLLYAMERDMAYFLDQLGEAVESPKWARLAEQRAERIRTKLWDSGRGLFADHDFVRGGTRHYPFATTFFPLWAGVATPEQARRTATEALRLLAGPGGLATSTNASGSQWDAPFAWAPLQLVAVEGLRRYGFTAEADQLALSFLGTVLNQFIEHGTVFEKYDASRRRADVAPGLRFGYASNEIGFGWTNAVFLELEAGLGARSGERIVRAAGAR